MDRQRVSPTDNTPTTINGVDIDVSRLRAISPIQRSSAVLTEDMFNEFENLVDTKDHQSQLSDSLIDALSPVESVNSDDSTRITNTLDLTKLLQKKKDEKINSYSSSVESINSSRNLNSKRSSINSVRSSVMSDSSSGNFLRSRENSPDSPLIDQALENKILVSSGIVGRNAMNSAKSSHNSPQVRSVDTRISSNTSPRTQIKSPKTKRNVSVSNDFIESLKKTPTVQQANLKKSPKKQKKSPAPVDIPDLPVQFQNIEPTVNREEVFDESNDNPYEDFNNNPYNKDRKDDWESRNVRYIPPPTKIIHGHKNNIINYTVPDYYTMSNEERMQHLTHFINRYATLRTVYSKMDIPKIKNSIDPAYLRLVYINYMGLIRQTDANSSIELYRFFVVLYLIMLELFVTNVMKINVTGMSSKFYKSRWMAYYEAAMHEMCETGGSNFTEGWNPILKIIFYGLIQTLAIVGLKILYNWLGPAAASIVEQLMMQFMGTNESITQPADVNAAVEPATVGPDAPPAVPEPSSGMPNMGGFDVNSILTGLTGMFNGSRQQTPQTTTEQPQPSTKSHTGPKHKR